ncbi:hypothetical protein Cpir12675_003969 [Ceratocystis pirilliformis]|uniref:Uncharacterized protein n=1 Tax=Ceratocystis pirilliformis TaxID=259994 RepID=A0ABR3YZM3_9PEZI
MEAPKITRVGRGGAGNLQSQEFLNNCLETHESYNIPKTRESSQYVSGGRGGAGNFAAPSDNAGSLTEQLEDAVQARTRASVSSGAGRSGRGGAGNWNAEVSLETNRQAETARQKIMATIDAKVEEMVNSDLAAPPKTYSGH